jgi:predicted nuclease with TOPRIM domain
MGILKLYQTFGLTIASIRGSIPSENLHGIKRGGRVADIYIAVSGFEKSIEENISKLIEECYGESGTVERSD